MPIIKGNERPNKLQGESNVFGVINSIYGYGGDDTLDGGFHAENWIYGGAGNDTITGGTEINRLYGEGGDDLITIRWDDTDSEAHGGKGNDKLFDTSWMGQGGHVLLDGGSGADEMHGGSGSNTYVVDHKNDRVIETWTPEYDNERSTAVDTVRAAISYRLAGDARIEVLETVNASAKTTISLTGNGFSQTLRGDRGDNSLFGQGGNDLLIGGAGKDQLDGGKGFDTASYADSTKAVGVDLNRPFRNAGDAAGDRFTSIENLKGSSFDDSLRGDGGNNRIAGGRGTDRIFGGSGADQLGGDAGDDRLEGGSGQDTMTGGAGSDRFVFTSVGDADRITDFSLRDDSLLLAHSAFSTLRPGELSPDAFVANTSGRAADSHDRVIYESDTGKVFYDADGSGKGKAINIATLSAHLNLTEDSFLVF